MLRFLSSSHHSHNHTKTSIAAIGGTISCTLLFLSTNTKPTSSDSDVDGTTTTATTSTPENQQHLQQHLQTKKQFKTIETDLMDTIAQKSYLNYHLSSGSYHYGQESSAGVGVGVGAVMEERPKGVPEVLRVMVIDVPEFRQVFDEECHVDLSAIFPDGIAFPKKVQAKKPQTIFGKANQEEEEQQQQQQQPIINNDPNPNHDTTIEVMQKSLIRSLSKCGKKNKTILLEASISNLNPQNMKRRFSYRPRVVKEEEKEESQRVSSKKDDYMEPDVHDYPWFQKAWIEEMELRINGKVPFSAPLEPSSKLSRFLFGNYYRSSIPPSTSFLRRYLLFPFLTSQQNQKQYTDGIDSTFANNRASNKPHAVIADGAAMYSVPGSLLHLSRCCKEAGVPLFIINDPRSWGQNTHSDVKSAARDLRKAVKRAMIRNALKIKEGSSFERGRRLGKAETQLGYEIKEASAKTKRSLMDAKKSLEGEDWSGLDKVNLRNELIRKKVISVKKKAQNGEVEVYGCTDGMRNVCEECLQDQKIEKDKPIDEPKNT